jgi:hypothetical protein
VSFVRDGILFGFPGRRLDVHVADIPVGYFDLKKSGRGGP